jgi:hypothetical protein
MHHKVLMILLKPSRALYWFTLQRFVFLSIAPCSAPTLIHIKNTPTAYGKL